MKFNPNNLVRDNIVRLEPYSSARSEFSGTAGVWLDANESPFNDPYNRYPDPLQKELKAQISKIKGVDASSIFLGNGSDECIDLVYRVFCTPGTDNVVSIAPSYGMYEVCADINDVQFRKVMLNDNFSLDFSKLAAACNAHTKAVWICSPNNPTGNAFATASLLDFCRNFNGIVVIDEAYIDFSSKGTTLAHLAQTPNLIVLQTFSKAWGSAGVRLGMAFASPEIISIFNKVKYPYNVNLLTQRYALNLVTKASEIKQWVSTILAERDYMVNALGKIAVVQRIYPSDANFILVKVDDADVLYDYLKSCGIIVRNRNRVEKCLCCLRITIGNHDENVQLVNAINDYAK